MARFFIAKVPGRFWKALLLVCVLLVGFFFYSYFKLPHGMTRDEYEEYVVLIENQLGGLVTGYNPDTFTLYASMFRDAQDWVHDFASEQKVRDHLNRHQITQLRALLSRGASLLETAQIDNIFEAFRGKWEGEWHQDNTVLNTKHHWHTPEALDSHPTIVVQAVQMTTNDNPRRTIAINSLSKQTGIILGAVGVNNGIAQRPHIGYAPDEKNLIWIALENACAIANPALERGVRSRKYKVFRSFRRFPCLQAGESQSSEGDTRLYSLFYESILNNGQMYHIDGFDFYWNRRLKKLTLNRHKFGQMKRIN